MVSFFAEAAALPEIRRRIREEALPRFAQVPGFRGIAVVHSEGDRSEILAMSLWDEELDISEDISEAIREEIEKMTGRAPSRKAYDVDIVTVPGKTPGEFLHLV
jgi:heme-degrading monooxygenase HmoA